MTEEIDSLDDERFTEQFTSFTDSAWRLETLDSYSVAYEEAPYERFLAGYRGDELGLSNAWIEDVIAPAVADGRYIGRVHVIERHTDTDAKLALSDYLRFEFESYKRHKAAGEDIRIAWVEPGTWVSDVWGRGHDFWLFDPHTDHGRLMEMHYHPDGTFRKAILTDNPDHVERAHRCAKAAHKVSKPFYP